MGAVDEAQLSEEEGDVLLRIVWDTANPASAGGSHSTAGCETPRGCWWLWVSSSLRLQAPWAAPRYSPEMLQWSRTVSPSRGMSHTWHTSVVRKAGQASRVILMASGFASTPLILHSSSCSDSKKCSSVLGPRYWTGGSVWPSRRTTM